MARPTKLEAALKHELGVERRLLEMVLKRVDEETQKDNLTGALHYRSRMEKIEAKVASLEKRLRKARGQPDVGDADEGDDRRRPCKSPFPSILDPTITDVEDFEARMEKAEERAGMDYGEWSAKHYDPGEREREERVAAEIEAGTFEPLFADETDSDETEEDGEEQEPQREKPTREEKLRVLVRKRMEDGKANNEKLQKARPRLEL